MRASLQTLAGKLAPLCLAAVAPLVAHAGLFDFTRPPRNLDVYTVTDTTESGRACPAPTPQQPQYYRAVSLGHRDIGAAIAGDPTLPEDVAVQIIARELAKLGYLPASEKTPPPTLVLVFAWGTLNADIRPSMTRGFPSAQTNRQQIVRFLGGEKLGITKDNYNGSLMPSSFSMRLMDHEARDFYAAGTDSYYIAVVTAYDLAAMERNPTVSLDHLWITRIACPTNGVTLPDVLPAMLAIAGPHLGRETPRPVRTVTPFGRQGTVSYGELQVVEYLGNSSPEVRDRSGRSTHPAPKKN